jgi:general secretion pathway protein G
MSVKERGFTLIELLVVIAIIGLLSSIVLASLNSARKKSRDARREADLKQLQTALELYFNDNSKYPIVTTSSSVADATNGLAAKGLTSTYMTTIPDDPSSGHYYYISTAAGDYYCLGAVIETTAPASSCKTTTVDPANSTNYKVGP